MFNKNRNFIKANILYNTMRHFNMAPNKIKQIQKYSFFLKGSRVAFRMSRRIGISQRKISDKIDHHYATSTSLIISE